MVGGRRILLYVLYFVLGLILIILGSTGLVDEFWSGMGAGLVAVGIVRGLQQLRLKKDPEYREKFETAVKDERNSYIRSKAWAWTGYIFILIAGASIIVFRVMGQELLSLAASWAVCLVLVLYWLSYQILSRKY